MCMIEISDGEMGSQAEVVSSTLESLRYLPQKRRGTLQPRCHARTREGHRGRIAAPLWQTTSKKSERVRKTDHFPAVNDGTAADVHHENTYCSLKRKTGEAMSSSF